MSVVVGMVGNGFCIEVDRECDDSVWAVSSFGTISSGSICLGLDEGTFNAAEGAV